MRVSDPAMMSAPARPRSDDSRRGSVDAGAMKRTKNAVPRPRAIPAYESARPATSSGLGGGAASGTGGGVGIGPFPRTKAKRPWVVGPSTPPVGGQGPGDPSAGTAPREN